MLQKPDRDSPDSAHDLGTRLRNRRKGRGLTMQAVADSAGLTAGFISQVERNLAAPSLSSLTCIAEALDAHITDFLQAPPDAAEVSRDALRELYAVPGGTVAYERLSTTFPGSRLTAVLIHEPPGRRSEPMRHSGEELFFVLEGELTVVVDGATSVLRRGDSIHFDSRRPHSTWNHTDGETIIIVCNTMDVFGGDDGDGEKAPDGGAE